MSKRRRHTPEQIISRLQTLPGVDSGSVAARAPTRQPARR